MRYGNAAKINSYFNKIEARKDWDLIAAQARGLGYGEIVDELQPPATAGWRMIDKARQKLWEWITPTVLEGADEVSQTLTGEWFAFYGDRTFGPVHRRAEAEEFLLKCVTGEDPAP